MSFSGALWKIKGDEEIRHPFTKKKKKNGGRGKKRGVILILKSFLTRGRELISLHKQKLRALRLMNRLALSKRKAGILQKNCNYRRRAAAERVGSPVPRGVRVRLRETSPLRVRTSVNIVVAAAAMWSMDSTHIVHTSFASPCQFQIRCLIFPIGYFLEETWTAAILAQESEQLMTYIVSCSWFLESFPCFVTGFHVLFLYSWSAVNCGLIPCSPWDSQTGEQEVCSQHVRLRGGRQCKGVE